MGAHWHYVLNYGFLVGSGGAIRLVVSSASSQEQSCGDKSMALEKRLGGGGRGRAGQALVSC